MNKVLDVIQRKKSKGVISVDPGSQEKAAILANTPKLCSSTLHSGEYLVLLEDKILQISRYDELSI